MSTLYCVFPLTVPVFCAFRDFNLRGPGWPVLLIGYIRSPGASTKNEAPMPKGQKNELTLKQEAACQALMELKDKSAAYRKAYDCEKMKPEVVNIRAFEFFKKSKIEVRVAELQLAALKRNEISVDRILQEEKCLSFYDIANIFNADGTMKNIHAIPENLRRAIAGVQVNEVFGREHRTIKTKIKLADKGRSLERISKHLGMYVERHEHSLSGETLRALLTGLGLDEDEIHKLSALIQGS